MPTMIEIRTEWKAIRSALGNLICYIDGKSEQLGEIENSWQKGYECGHRDGLKAGEASVLIDKRELVKTRWEEIQVEFANDTDLQIASMLCGNCRRWHNTVYHYGNPVEFANYCPFCGADMKGKSEGDEK